MANLLKFQWIQSGISPGLIAELSSSLKYLANVWVVFVMPARPRDRVEEPARNEVRPDHGQLESPRLFDCQQVCVHIWNVFP
jgi:hypothetical protein